MSSSSQDTDDDSSSDQLHHTPHANLGHHAQAHQLQATEPPTTSRRMPHSRSHRDKSGRRPPVPSSSNGNHRGRLGKAQQRCGPSVVYHRLQHHVKLTQTERVTGSGVVLSADRHSRAEDSGRLGEMGEAPGPHQLHQLRVALPLGEMPMEALDAALAGLAAADPNHELALDPAAMALHDNDDVRSAGLIAAMRGACHWKWCSVCALAWVLCGWLESTECWSLALK